MLLTTFAVLAFAQTPPPLEPGVTVRVYDIQRSMDRLHPLAPDQTPNHDQRYDTIDFRTDTDFPDLRDLFYVEALGFLKIDAPGRHEFRLVSDDGSRLTIDGERIIDHDGLHGATGKDGAIELAAGLHPFRIIMFENQGGAALSFQWRPPGVDAFTVVPRSALRVEKGVTRVVSPGRKVILDGREHLEPGDGLPLEDVHPGWTLEDLRPPGFEPQVGGMAFLPDGRLVLSSFPPVNNGILREAPNGTLWVVDGLRDEGPVRYDRIADGFHDPAGVAVVGGDIYVAHRTDITRLADRDGDGVFEHREVFASGWESDNYHHFTFGLAAHDGWLYGALSTSIYFGNTITTDGVEGTVVSMNGPNPEHRGTCFRVDLETRALEFLAGGFRTPNGLGVGPEGSIFVTDNQGAWLPASKLIHMKPGRFYGHYNGTREQTSRRYPQGGFPSLHDDQPVSPPAVWLPQNECANSPTESLLIRSGPFAGQMYVGELTMGGIRRVFLEEVDGEYQGAAFRFCQGFEAGVNRLVEGPDGCLYVGGTGAGGNWTWRGTTFGLQRLRPTTGSAFEYHAMSATPDGFAVSFTRPVPRAWLEDPANYRLTQWRYAATPQYGGPKRDVERLWVARATASGDRRSVRLIVPGLRAGHVVHLRANPRSDFDETIWSTEAWYTLNRIPAASTTTPATLEPLGNGLDAFADPGAWAVVGDVRTNPDDPKRLASAPGAGVIWNGDRGWTRDLVTRFDHRDVAVHIEFMVPEGSNSGVYFMGRYEIQVLDSYGVEQPQHSDCGGVYQRWSPSRGAGNEGYEGVPPRVNASTRPGTWQTFDVVFRAPRFDTLGRKTRNARFQRVVHNGTVIHEDIEVTGPTRAGFDGPEVAAGPLRLQGDHGPVAYRNIVITPLD